MLYILHARNTILLLYIRKEAVEEKKKKRKGAGSVGVPTVSPVTIRHLFGASAVFRLDITFSFRDTSSHVFRLILEFY